MLVNVGRRGGQLSSQHNSVTALDALVVVLYGFHRREPSVGVPLDRLCVAGLHV